MVPLLDTMGRLRKFIIRCIITRALTEINRRIVRHQTRPDFPLTLAADAP
jgi:hypothetical protein